MANLYKKALINRDPATGKRTPYKTDKWWGRYRDAHGVTKRVALSENKLIAQRMLGEIVQQVELQKSGLIQPQVVESKRKIDEHLEEFLQHQRAKNNVFEYVNQMGCKLRKVFAFCHWKRITDITAVSTERFLTDLRENGNRSIATGNHYLRAVKIFVNWLVETDRLIKSPLKSLKMLNTSVAPRHQRRAFSDEEFSRLLEAARHGGPSWGLTGSDRAMLYILAAWTGFRRGELASLTLRSFDLTSNPPTVKIEAAYSKRRRQDVQVLHPDLVDALLAWLPKRFREVEPASTPLATFVKMHRLVGIANEPLFPLSQPSGGRFRKTGMMIAFDLETAKQKWVAEAEDDEEAELREQSDFLSYKNADGKFADFHGLRHAFVSNLSRAGVSPKTAQVLARHSDISLTMNIYTHVDQAEQVEAILALPGLKR